MLSSRRMTGMPPGERRSCDGADERRHRRDMNKPATPEVAAPTGRWRVLAARCLNPGGITLSSRLRNALFVLFLGGILAYGAGFAWYMLAHLDLIDLIRDLIEDDAFYYFQIARNLAEGKFSTFDGGITRTNGYHPLWLFLITPFYWVFDKEAALFAIKAFEIMLVAGGVALVTAAVRLAHMPWYLMFAALPMLYSLRALPMLHHIRFMTAGMEAAAALFLLGLFLLTACLFARNPTRWKWPLAAVAFVLPWVRLEYVAISLAVTAALCLIEWSRRDSPSPHPVEGAEGPGAPEKGSAHSVPVMNTVAPLLGAVAGILVYFAYNGIVFGAVAPVSGATKQMLSQRLWEQEGGYSLVQNFRDILQIPAFDYELLVALEVCAYFVLVWWFSRRSRSRTDRLLLAFLVCVFGLAVGHLAKFAQTVLTMHPHWGSDGYYFVPAYLLMTLSIPVRCHVAIHFIRRCIGPGLPRAANILSVGIVVVGAAFLFAKADFTGPFRYVDRESESTRQKWMDTSYMGVQVMNRVLPEDSVIGSWDAGVIGYFSRHPVVNLDGLANSYDYMRARKEGTEAALYQRYGLTHFANMFQEEGRVLQLLEPPSGGVILFEGSPYFRPGINVTHKRQFRLLTIEPPEVSSDGIHRSDWFWQRMEPHFDHRSDGVGLIVDGRAAQAFVRNCAPDELAAWSRVGPGEETAFDSWTRTQTGLCVNSRVLPHNALPSVRVATMSVSDWVSGPLGGARPIIRSDWDVYLVEDSLIYAKDQCGPEDTEPSFFVHLDPVDRNDLPGDRRQYGFDGFHFEFRNHLLIEGGVCVARRELPVRDYAIAAIRTGQFIGDGENIWEDRFEVVEPVETMSDSDYLIGLTGGGLPVIRSDWDVYLVEDSLIYAKEQCSPEDTEPLFFVHLDPVDRNDLPDDRRQYGFDGFNFDLRNHLLDGRVCVARRELPVRDYAIAAIRTGQFIGDGNNIWEGTYTRRMAGKPHRE